jgi:hypothetical protein
MGGASTPLPMDDLGPPMIVDAGTLALIGTPLPGPIGLQAKAGTAKPGAVSMPAQIVAYARGKISQSVGSGECFDLVDEALRKAGAKSAADFGTITPNADYVWGTSIALADVQPGDVIQFRNYRYDRTIDTATAADTDFQERPHHTAIVERVDADGALTVLEQNVPDGSPGQRTQLFFSNVNTSTGGKKTTIKVKGTVRFYRPQAR